MSAHFNTITGSDWRVSLKAARARRKINELKFTHQIETAMIKIIRSPRSRMDYRPSAKMLAKYGPKKETVLQLLRGGLSAGGAARNQEIPYHLANYWRNEAGIAPLKPGFRNPTPAVGEVLT